MRRLAFGFPMERVAVEHSVALPERHSARLAWLGALFARPATRLFLTVLISVVVHLVAVGSLSKALLFGLRPLANPHRHALSVGLVGASLVDTNPSRALVANDPEAVGASPSESVSAQPAKGRLSGTGDAAAPERDRPERKRELISPYLPPSQVDRAAYPLSALDLSPLQFVTSYSGFPVRLRIFVDAVGQVVDVKILHALPADEEAATLLAQILEHGGFVPARRQGQPVASFMDVEYLFNDQAGKPLVR